MSADASDFKYSELRLAGELGLSRVDLKFIRDRHLEPDRDWKKNGGGLVAITETGVSKILDALGGALDFDVARCLLKAEQQNERASLPSLPEKNGAVKMIVSKIPFNPRVVLAIDDASETYTVDVCSSENFVVGDEIEAVPHPSQAGFYRFVGPMPRSRRRVEGRVV